METDPTIPRGVRIRMQLRARTIIGTKKITTDLVLISYTVENPRMETTPFNHAVDLKKGNNQSSNPSALKGFLGVRESSFDFSNC